MEKHQLVVQYVTQQNCFVYLPENVASRWLRKVDGIQISHNCNNYYVSWRPASGHNDTLGINATFARTLDLKEGDIATVSPSIDSLPFLSAITLTPTSPQDWQIVEYQADKVQSVLLQQISVVATNQTIVVWISKGLSVTLTIDAIDPDFLYGRIGNGTEVHVNAKSARVDKNEKSIKTSDTNLFQQSSISIIPFLTDKLKKSNEKDIEQWHLKEKEIFPPETFHVYDLTSIKRAESSPYDVFVDEWNVPRARRDDRLYKIRKVREDREDVDAPSRTNFLRIKNDDNVPKQSRELVVRVLVVERDDSENRHNTVHKIMYMSTNLRRNLKLPIGSKILLECVKPSDKFVTSIEIFPSTTTITRQDIDRFLGDAVEANKEILLNSRSTVYLKNGTSFMVLCTPAESSYVLLDSIGLKNVPLNIKKVAPAVELEDIDTDNSSINLELVSLEVGSILDECRIVLESSLRLNEDFCSASRCHPENVLVCGQVGVGKSIFCRALQAHMLKATPYFVYSRVLECKTFKGKKVEAFQKILLAAMSECIYYQPSILLLDDLDVITNSPSDDQALTPDAINAARILDVIFNTAAEFQSSHYVSIIATCTDINKIGAKLRSPRGVHLFQTVVTIPELTKASRIDILKLALEAHVRVLPKAINWDDYGNKTEGWVARDLVDFAEKTAFAAWKRHVHDKITGDTTLTEDDLCLTLKNYKAISLHGVQLYESFRHDWSHVGGLAKVKVMLTQLLEWPLKYPELYRDAPIKNQNGILLYGMPGTGKTILAGAIAKQCRLNLISVKGPELLSKYIGASEEAVRNIFEKARRAKPCVLFFDEFDSLAPRRGHDSTGVTDRVVNQLLTQLDGVEGREGVAIVAASSRPDLLDPALLRPGRLDKSLLCPLPDENDRQEILIALCKTQRMDTTNLDLKSLAKMSDGFTGADLNGVLTQAKYAAFESGLEEDDASDQLTCPDSDLIRVSQEHIIESLESTKPSVSSSEKDKYRKIYEQFSKGDGGTNDVNYKQKTTLA